jgi:F-type H+-transporting ATPase subunit b
MSMLKEGKSQAEMIVKSAAEEAERVKQVKLEEAKREISREKELALQSLRNEVASLVIQATDKVIGKVVSAEQHKGLVESAISELSNN